MLKYESPQITDERKYLNCNKNPSHILQCSDKYCSKNIVQQSGYGQKGLVVIQLITSGTKPVSNLITNCLLCHNPSPTSEMLSQPLFPKLLYAPLSIQTNTYVFGDETGSYSLQCES